MRFILWIILGIPVLIVKIIKDLGKVINDIAEIQFKRKKDSRKLNTHKTYEEKRNLIKDEMETILTEKKLNVKEFLKEH